MPPEEKKDVSKPEEQPTGKAVQSTDDPKKVTEPIITPNPLEQVEAQLKSETPFQDVGALIKGYKEIQAYNQRIMNEHQADRQKYAAMEQQAREQQAAMEEMQTQRDMQMDDETFNQLMRANPLQTQQRIVDFFVNKALQKERAKADSQVRQQEASNKVTRFLTKFPDQKIGKQVLGQVWGIMQRNPQLQNLENGFDLAYDVLKGRSAGVQIQDEVDKRIEAQKNAQILSDGKTPTPKSLNENEEYIQKVKEVKANRFVL